MIRAPTLSYDFCRKRRRLQSGLFKRDLNGREPAHEEGKKAETDIKGVTRVSDDPSKTKTNSDKTVSGIYDVNYKDNKTGQTTKVSMEIDHSDVKKVKRQ